MKNYIIFLILFSLPKIIQASFIDSVQINSKVLWNFGRMTLEDINMNVYFVRIDIKNKSPHQILLFPDLESNQLYELQECYYGTNYNNRKQYGLSVGAFTNVVVYKIYGRSIDKDPNENLNFRYICTLSDTCLIKEYSFLIQPSKIHIPKYNKNKWKTRIEYESDITFLKFQNQHVGKDFYSFIFEYEKKRNDRVVTFKIDFR